MSLLLKTTGVPNWLTQRPVLHRPSSRRFLRGAEAMIAALCLMAAAFAVWTSPAPESGEVENTKMRPGLANDAGLSPFGEVIISGYTGVPYTYPSDVVVTAANKHDFAAKQVEWIGEPFDNPIYYGVRVARWGRSTRSGWMVDFTHSKAIAERSQILDIDGTLNGAPAPQGQTVRDVFDKLEASHGHNMLTLNGLLRFASFGSVVHPYAGLGAGISLPHSEIHFKGEKKRTYEYQYAGPVAQGLIGVEFRFARTSYFLEYKFTFAPYDMPLSERNGTLLIFDLWAQFKNWWDGVAPPGGRLSTTFASHQVIGGIGVRIVPTPVALP